MRAFAFLFALAVSGCMGGPVPGGSGAGGGGASPPPLATWDALPEAPLGRTENAAVAVGERIYVMGGLADSGLGGGLAGATALTRVDVLDLATGAWRRAPDLPVPIHHTAAVALGSRIVVLGGYVGPSFTPTGQAWSLDTDAEAAGWISFSALPGPRGAHAAASDGERIWVFGGVGGPLGLATPAASGLTGVSWVYEGGAWREVAALPQPRDHLAGAYLDGLVYAVGGRELTLSSNTDRLDVYDPTANEWTLGAPMPTARGGLGAAAFEGMVVALGGEADDGTFAEVEAYDPRRGAWSTLTPLPEARHGFGVSAAGPALVVALGGPEPSFTYSATVQRLRFVSDVR